MKKENVEGGYAENKNKRKLEKNTRIGVGENNEEEMKEK